MAPANMTLSLDNIGKRFQYHWIFRNIELSITSGQTLAIKGSNGSGKSTLLRIISGFLSPSEGQIKFQRDNKIVNEFYRHISYAAPYVDLINQFNLSELIHFHQKFKPFRKGITEELIFDLLAFPNIDHKILKDFSSGMQQRVKLVLAVLSESELCILDEPTTNLDEEGFHWYEKLIKEYRGDSAIVIASNESRDFIAEDFSLTITDYKK